MFESIQFNYVLLRRSMSVRFWQWLAFRMPPVLVYHCTIRAGGYATVGKYGGDCPDDVSVMEVLKRWEGQYKK